MVCVPVHLPSLLAGCAQGTRDVEIGAETVRECIDNLLEAYPLLRNHLFEEDGTQREHVLIYYNDENTQWLDTLDHRLREGDTMTIIQSVSGG